MARMNPAQLSDRVLNDKKLRGEREVFEALSKLPDEFEVFYNRCANAGGATKAFERKIDFIVIHEKLGFLAIEVKGGKIRIGNDGGFEQYHYSKGWNSIDPFTQVKVAFIELVKTIRADGGDYWIPGDLCVLFPGTSRHDLTDMPQSLPAGTLCSDDVPTLAIHVPKLFSKNYKNQAWKRDEFIDVRRRLQNMPEAKRGKKLSDQEFTAQKNYEDVTPQLSTSSYPEFVKPFASNIDTIPKRQSIKYHPSADYAPFKDRTHKTETYKKPFAYHRNLHKPAKLKWWEIAAATMAAIITFIAVSWFMPASPINPILKSILNNISLTTIFSFLH